MDLDGLDKSRLPQHVAIIMDGNGRWALSRGKHRIEGHRRGKTSVRVIVEMARKSAFVTFPFTHFPPRIGFALTTRSTR